MTLRTNPYYKLFMNTILLHCLMCFFHAMFEDESAIVYICMLYVGAIIVGQHLIRKRVHNFFLYLLFHLLLIAPCILFLAISITDVVFVGIFAVISTILSFKKSIASKQENYIADVGFSPIIALLLPLFAILGSFYDFPVYLNFVFWEALIFFILLICYTFNFNENQYVRDHCTTVNIPTKRLLATTAGIRYVFIAVIIAVMLLVKGIDIVLPMFSPNFDPSMAKPPIHDTTPGYTDPSQFSGFEDITNPPSALAIFLSYVFAALAVVIVVILLFIFIISIIKTLRGSIYATEENKVYFEDEEITVEALSVGHARRKFNFERPTNNNEKIRKIFKNTTAKKLNTKKGPELNSMLKAKTPSEINNVIKYADKHSDEVIGLYNEARYSGHEMSDDDVRQMKIKLSSQKRD